jgi:hypothetical protein
VKRGREKRERRVGFNIKEKGGFGIAFYSIRL